MSKQTFYIFLIFFILSSLLFFILHKQSEKSSNLSKANATTMSNSSTLWKYQCIDTMKTSRDKARAWRTRVDLQKHIDMEIEAIKDMGANCVALDTPYDEEFLSYLKLWVDSARKENLYIWYRGNFSSWEGWFEYKKGMSSKEHLAKTKEFILNHPELFIDGDIFTPAPEAENGGPFNQVEVDEHVVFRQFLIEEYKVAKDAFSEIGKEVEVNWLSMNGGLAKRMLDQKTIDSIGGVVTIDHYIKTSPEMGEFINYFHDKYNAKVVIGEFGAPIPEINGSMTEREQAQFIDELFWEMYIYKDNIEGVSYWVLYDGSTTLLNADGSSRQVVDVVKKYFTPGIITGTVTNTVGETLEGISVKTEDGLSTTVTNNQGQYTLVIPAGDKEIIIFDNKYNSVKYNLSFTPGDKITKDVALEPQKVDFLYWLKSKMKGFKIVKLGVTI